MVETPPCVCKAHDCEALCISLDRCSEETSGVVSASEEIVLQKNKIGRYRMCTSDNYKIHSYMPKKINHKTNDKAKTNQSHKLFDALSELKQLQLLISTEHLNNCQLVEEVDETFQRVNIMI